MSTLTLWRPRSTGRPHSNRCGTLWIGPHASASLEDDGAPHPMLLWSVRVERRHRRQGHGRRLMEAIIAHADEVGRPIRLQVETDNEAAINLYLSLGFIIQRQAYPWPAHAMIRQPRGAQR